VSAPRHPFRLTPARQLSLANADRAIADLVRLVLLTGPGERLHHADFGAGLGAAALFEPLDPALLGIIEVRARGSLERALGDRIEVTNVAIGRVGESTITAAVTYRRKPAGTPITVDVAVSS
jgi:phage baseplate assembly protein W